MNMENINYVEYFYPTNKKNTSEYNFVIKETNITNPYKIPNISNASGFSLYSVSKVLVDGEILMSDRKYTKEIYYFGNKIYNEEIGKFIIRCDNGDEFRNVSDIEIAIPNKVIEHDFNIERRELFECISLIISIFENVECECLIDTNTKKIHLEGNKWHTESMREYIINIDEESIFSHNMRTTYTSGEGNKTLKIIENEDKFIKYSALILSIRGIVNKRKYLIPVLNDLLYYCYKNGSVPDYSKTIIFIKEYSHNYLSEHDRNKLIETLDKKNTTLNWVVFIFSHYI